MQQSDASYGGLSGINSVIGGRFDGVSGNTRNGDERSGYLDSDPFGFSLPSIGLVVPQLAEPVQVVVAVDGSNVPQ